ncbi:Cd(II)/Pb(II)-responsive transcriptional regulator [Roseateles asaccharophilus]|jgi:Cd(II)/Pb(II)-responsive transcriptional regulator|uniref:Cd(II)/Pb(II)-responsive transcriptional regulator n=1 Tax=Roseateles asaccharophilus TaxID=582607 RepID=A0ABU2AG97_9BURK|nr:Cd(II)/Pb(II)-responsive transcriptional regulator [Roseateles asaccharophilus]MDR7336240.1 Cd(II)/Pb(II)-responsive transcriptional regulator [Roseateles asaccharophilus]
MKIGQLAKATDTLTETIRFYERQGLLPPPARTTSNYREYAAEHIQRLAFIRHCRSLDMTLAEIGTLLRFKDAPGAGCGDVDALIQGHIEQVVTRIRALRSLEADLRALRKSCSAGRVAADCGILTGLRKAAESRLA